jgi:hypothetical protein
MIEVAKQLDLTQGAKTKHRVIKRSDAFDSYFALRWYMDSWTGTQDELSGGNGIGRDERGRLPDNPISAFADDVEELIVTTDGKVGYARIYDVVHA